MQTLKFLHKIRDIKYYSFATLETTNSNLKNLLKE